MEHLFTGGDRDRARARGLFTKTTVTEPACRMEYHKFNAASPHPYIVSPTSAAPHNIPVDLDMASRRGVSKRPASSEGRCPFSGPSGRCNAL